MKKILITIFICLHYISVGQVGVSNNNIEIDSLIELSILNTDKKEFDKALELNKIAEEFLKKNIPIDSIEYAKLCFNYGRVYYNKNELVNSEVWYTESLRIRKNILGVKNLQYGLSLTNVANVNVMKGNYKLAESQYIESKKIQELNEAKKSNDYSVTLINLANLYLSKMQLFEEAEKVYLSLQEIVENQYGKESKQYAGTMAKLATVYFQSGQYDKSELNNLEAIRIQAKLFGTSDPIYAQSLSNLADLYTRMGQYSKALELYLNSAKVLKETLGTKTKPYVTCINNLAILYTITQDFQKAEPLFLECNAFKKKLYGAEHPLYVSSLLNLGLLYKNLRRNEDAKSAFLEVISIQEKVANTNSPVYSAALNNLANIYLELGELDKAESLFLKGIDICLKTRGKSHQDYPLTIIGLMDLYENQEKFSSSDSLMQDYLTSNKERLFNSIDFLSNKELTEFAITQKVVAIQLFSFMNSRKLKNFSLGNLTNLGFDYIMFQKGFLLNAVNQVSRIAALLPENKILIQNLKGSKDLIASELSKPVSEQTNLKDLEEKANILEKQLARSITLYKKSIHQVSWQETLNSLKADEACIEFVHFHIIFPSEIDSTIYGALLLKSGESNPEFVPLFEEHELYKTLSQKNKKQSTELLAQIYTRGASPVSTNNSQERLYDLCWKPLDSLLKGVKTVYYSPTGLLYQINFDAIPIEKGITLSDRHKLVRLGSTRSLVIPDQIKVNTSNEVVLYGGIQYEIDTTQLKVDTIPEQIKSTTSEISFAYADRSVPQRGNTWNYLPGTEKEVKEIASITKKSKYPNQIFQGKFATEESFKNLGKLKESPRVIHLATHGFFFPDIKDTSQHSNSLGEQPAFKISDHPMIRSGLLLTGANLAWKTGKPWKEGMEDGILTAYEISQMNLSNTELVVLSACETGLGDIQGNEGVYGLQRAFKIAGVKYLIMSLWQIPDEETKEFMISFYKNWLNKKIAIPDAFRTSQKEMQKRYSNPYLWAGFVLVE